MNNLKKISREELKNVKGGRRYCQSYVMIAWCNDNTATDTVCYDLDSQQSKDEAYACMTHNGQLFNVYTCGSEDYGS
ncbi:bacteriocin-like protein [Chryseobacterium sp.]|uniref:bacteriocin-like protein n=1 Tax=unclassified Chryseobacterium TaxID=2593645 RepID=UPI0028A18472|nr:hypothetical protein [Chryseobacterium sp.]